MTRVEALKQREYWKMKKWESRARKTDIERREERRKAVCSNINNSGNKDVCMDGEVVDVINKINQIMGSVTPQKRKMLADRGYLTPTSSK